MGPDAIRAVLFDKMRDAMRDDISRAMELAEPARVPPRLTRKQQAKAADMQEQAPASGAGGAGGDGAAGGVAPMEEDVPEAVRAESRLCWDSLNGGVWAAGWADASGEPATYAPKGTTLSC